MPVVEGELGSEDANVGELFAQSQRGKLAHSIRLQVDPVTHGLQRGNRFVNATVDADLMEAERGRQTRNTATDDDHLHAMSSNPLSSARYPHRE